MVSRSPQIKHMALRLTSVKKKQKKNFAVQFYLKTLHSACSSRFLAWTDIFEGEGHLMTTPRSSAPVANHSMTWCMAIKATSKQKQCSFSPSGKIRNKLEFPMNFKWADWSQSKGQGWPGGRRMTSSALVRNNVYCWLSFLHRSCHITNQTAQTVYSLGLSPNNNLPEKQDVIFQSLKREMLPKKYQRGWN